MAHGKLICKVCKDVIMQCRCPDHGGNITETTMPCDKCKAKEEKPTCLTCGSIVDYDKLADHNCSGEIDEYQNLVGAVEQPDRTLTITTVTTRVVTVKTDAEREKFLMDFIRHMAMRKVPTSQLWKLKRYGKTKYSKNDNIQRTETSIDIVDSHGRFEENKEDVGS